MEKKSLFLWVIALTLLGLSFYFFYNAYELWSKYREAIETLRRLHSEPNPGRFFSLEELSIQAIQAYNRYFLFYLFGGIVFLAGATIVFVLRAKLTYLDLRKPLAQLGRNYFTLGIAVVLSLLIISGFFFYRAYDLWSEYQRIIDIPEIITVIPSFSMIETYYRYFPLYLFCGLVALESAIIVFMFQTKLVYIDFSKPFVSFEPRAMRLGARGFTFTLGIAVSGLLIISGFLLYGAYNLWSRYRSPQEEFYPVPYIVPHFDYHRIVDAQIATYEKLFLPYLLGGLVTISMASIIPALSLRRKNP